MQSEEAEIFAAFVREYERIDGADMIARGVIKGTAPISDRFRRLQAKTTAPVAPRTREELSRAADELYARHEAAMHRRPVS